MPQRKGDVTVSMDDVTAFMYGVDRQGPFVHHATLLQWMQKMPGIPTLLKQIVGFHTKVLVVDVPPQQDYWAEIFEEMSYARSADALSDAVSNTKRLGIKLYNGAAKIAKGLFSLLRGKKGSKEAAKNAQQQATGKKIAKRGEYTVRDFVRAYLHKLWKNNGSEAENKIPAHETQFEIRLAAARGLIRHSIPLLASIVERGLEFDNDHLSLGMLALGREEATFLQEHMSNNCKVDERANEKAPNPVVRCEGTTDHAEDPVFGDVSDSFGAELRRLNSNEKLPLRSLLLHNFIALQMPKRMRLQAPEIVHSGLSAELSEGMRAAIGDLIWDILHTTHALGSMQSLTVERFARIFPRIDGTDETCAGSEKKGTATPLSPLLEHVQYAEGGPSIWIRKGATLKHILSCTQRSATADELPHQRSTSKGGKNNRQHDHDDRNDANEEERQEENHVDQNDEDDDDEENTDVEDNADQ